MPTADQLVQWLLEIEGACALRCDVAGVLRDTTIFDPLFIEHVTTPSGAEVPRFDSLGLVRVVGGDLIMAVVPGPAVAEFNYFRVARGRVGWPSCEPGQVVDCDFIEITSRYVPVDGVVSGEPVHGARVHGCGGSADVNEDGTFRIDVWTGPCDLRVVATQEGRTARGPAVALNPREVDNPVVELEYPDPQAFAPLSEGEIAKGDKRLDEWKDLCARQDDAALRAECKVVLVEGLARQLDDAEDAIEEERDPDAADTSSTLEDGGDR